MTKDLLRRQLKKERGQVPKPQRKIWDQAIFEHLTLLPAYQNAQNVMIYLSFGWEIHTWSIVDDLQNKGRQVWVPVVQKNPKKLLSRAYISREKLIPAAFGILEPGPEAATIVPGDIDLVIVPGLAFSEQGFRIGYGGGYYDRFLTTTNAQSVGLVYRAFVRDIPVETWDQPVDFLATEEGVVGRK